MNDDSVLEDATMVVTSSYVTEKNMPIVFVSHEIDEEDQSHVWQFHCGNEDYSMSKMQLVRFDTIAYIDSSVRKIFDLPVGMKATRFSKSDEWSYSPLEEN